MLQLKKALLKRVRWRENDDKSSKTQKRQEVNFADVSGLFIPENPD